MLSTEVAEYPLHIATGNRLPLVALWLLFYSLFHLFRSLGFYDSQVQVPLKSQYPIFLHMATVPHP